MEAPPGIGRVVVGKRFYFLTILETRLYVYQLIAESITRASFLSEDLKEGQLAFLEKRGPLFKGR